MTFIQDFYCFLLNFLCKQIHLTNFIHPNCKTSYHEHRTPNMLRYVLTYLLCCNTVLLFSQNSNLLRLWYLTKVTIDNTDYIPSDYGYYPDLLIEIKHDKYNLTLADPNHITISDDIKEFFTEPDRFTLYQGWFEMPTAMCYDGPDGPCTTIYGKHANFYYHIF